MIDLIAPRKAFNAAYLPALTAPQRTQIIFGGAGSGKSVFLATRAILDAMQGRNYLIVRQVARTLRSSCFQEVQKAIARFSLGNAFTTNKSDMAITCTLSGAQLLFMGLDDVEKIKSVTPARGPLTDIWIEEATETALPDMILLTKRLRGLSHHPKRITLSFNPVSKGHWIYRRFFDAFADDDTFHQSQDLLIIRTTYKDNRFLSPDDHAAYEAEADPYYRAVYTLGQWGQIGGAVFTNWRTATDLPSLDAHPLRMGLDFGYSSDPAAALLLQYDKKRRIIYARKELYTSGLTNDLLAKALKAMHPQVNIICDSAEPKSIAELRRYGVRAIPAKKGPDSILHGLQWLQQHELVIDPKLQNLLAELSTYRWRQDGHGSFIDKTEGPDHLMDALRYAMEADQLARYASPVSGVLRA